MEKKLENYLNLFLGQQIYTGTGFVLLVAVQMDDPNTVRKVIVENGNVIHQTHIDDKTRLVLRPLSAMTEEETKELCLICFAFAECKEVVSMKRMPSDGVGFSFICEKGYSHWMSMTTFNPEATRHLLSKGFDLFGLIDAGLAIEKK